MQPGALAGRMQIVSLRLTLEVFFHMIAAYWGEAGGANRGDLGNGAWVAEAIPLAVYL